ncbi:MAG: hypothetical protein HY942_02370 [Gammaproteobacteria bacterium]|nr:hypothetical protein [Gammaproteobacteria bacterium]
MIPTNNFKLVVALADFVGCLKAMRYGAKLGKRNIAREEVEFEYDGTNLTISAIGVDHTLPASGSWQGKVIIALPVMGGLRRVPPTQDPLTISYEDSKLKIGTTNIPATWLP